MNSFYWGSINATQSPLPIILTEFQGQSTPDGIQLTWVTESEITFDYFQVERSFDGLEFEPLAKINARGSSHGQTFYNYLDRTARNTQNYYRLKNVDLNGSSDYSKIIRVENDGSTPVIFPNPVVLGNFTVKVNPSSLPADFVLFNGLGKSLLSTELRNATTLISLPPGTPIGLYFVKISTSRLSHTFKILVN